MNGHHAAETPTPAAGPSGDADAQSGVKDDLTPKRAGRITETAEYAAFVRRILKAYGRRIANGDTDALPTLLAVAAEVDDVICQAPRTTSCGPASKKALS